MSKVKPFEADREVQVYCRLRWRWSEMRDGAPDLVVANGLPDEPVVITTWLGTVRCEQESDISSLAAYLRRLADALDLEDAL